jgi:hypothetical protein
MALGLAACTSFPNRISGFAEQPECAKLYDKYDDIRAESENVSDEVRKNPCWLRAKEERTNYDLLFAEFDDHGLPAAYDVGRSGEDHLGGVIDELVRIYEENRADGLSLVVYVHGWHHNAGAQDSNVTRFRELLQGMAGVDRLIASPKRPPRVVGIYIGWRGESVAVPLVNALTYWGRKDAADRVSQGSVRELFARLHLLRTRGRTNVDFKSLGQGIRLDAGERNVRLLTIGHSFGGRIVFQALSSDLMNAVTQALDDDSVPRFADLVVLINPALESIQYEPLLAASQRAPRLRENQLPTVIVAASTADLATGVVFSITRYLSTFFEPKPGAQNAATIGSLGHAERYITHRLDSCNPADKECADACGTKTNFAEEVFREKELMTRIRRGGFSMTGDQYFCGNLRLESAARWSVVTPFWVVSTTDNLMKDHNDFLNPNFVTFVRQIYIGLTARTK